MKLLNTIAVARASACASRYTTRHGHGRPSDARRTFKLTARRAERHLSRYLVRTAERAPVEIDPIVACLATLAAWHDDQETTARGLGMRHLTRKRPRVLTFRPFECDRILDTEPARCGRCGDVLRVRDRFPSRAEERPYCPGCERAELHYLARCAGKI